MMTITKKFVEVFNQSPDVIAAAPGRVNLIGEHIDYSDGFVLPFAIKDCTYVGIRKRGDRKIRISSAQRGNAVIEVNLDDVKPGLKGEWERYALGVIWSLSIKDGIDLFINGQVPIGAGLSSSAALECSIAMGLNELFNLGFDLPTLARLTQKAENEYVGMPCGIMDQSISLMAKAGSALLLDCRDLTTRDIPFDVAAHGLELLIIDTQVHHALVDGGYAERRDSCESVAKKLGVSSMRDLTMQALAEQSGKLTDVEFIRARHAVSEMARVLAAVDALSNENFDHLGKLLNGSHLSLRDDYNISCPELNLAVQTSLKAGALGARMVGGGFGGSAIALIDKNKVEVTKALIEQAFKAKKFKKPRFFTSLPSQGAKII